MVFSQTMIKAGNDNCLKCVGNLWVWQNGLGWSSGAWRSGEPTSFDCSGFRSHDSNNTRKPWKQNIWVRLSEVFLSGFKRRWHLWLRFRAVCSNSLNICPWRCINFHPDFVAGTVVPQRCCYLLIISPWNTVSEPIIWPNYMFSR